MSSTPPTIRRDAVVDLLAEARRPLHTSEIAEALDVPPRAYQQLQRLLDDLSFDGSIRAMPGQKFRLSDGSRGAREGRRGALETYQGLLSAHPRGFGFVSAAGKPEDVFIPQESMRGAMHGDTVIVRVVARNRRGLEGEISEIVKRRTGKVAGILRVRGRSAWLEPDDSRVRGPIVLPRLAPDDPRLLAGAPRGRGADGLAAVATIVRHPEGPDENPEGELDAVLGDAGDPNVEVQKILLREGIVEGHPPAAEAEAEAFGSEVSAEALQGREDLTGIPLPTIDPEDARDHDDALWVTRSEDGSYKAWVAIADVSHYVRPGTALDASSLERGNSVYLPDRAIPMLPRALSSNLCSLLPGVVRLCLALEIDIEPDGEVRRYRVVEGFMRSAAKLTYGGVARALGFSTAPPRSPLAEEMRDDLRVLADLAAVLRAKRMRKGALDFDLPEAKVTLHEETRAPLNVTKRAYDAGIKKAYQLVEELMLLANETVARFLSERGVPAIYRVHARPDEGKLERFVALCEELGLEFDVEDAKDPKRLSTFLRKIAGHEKKQVLHSLLLRAMKQAAYDPVNVGHFGLASGAYLHFTSPIRRYPDLVVHRLVKGVLRGEIATRAPRKEDEESEDPELEALRVAATTANECERRGMDVEREVVDLYRTLYMQGRLGEVFEGTVSAIVGSGLFVAIDDPFVDVLVRLESLGLDSYEIDDEGLRVIGMRSGDRIAIGDRMRIFVEEANLARRTTYGRRLPGLLADEPGDAAASGDPQGRRPRRGRFEERRGAFEDRRGGRRRGPELGVVEVPDALEEEASLGAVHAGPPELAPPRRRVTRRGTTAGRFDREAPSSGAGPARKAKAAGPKKAAKPAKPVKGKGKGKASKPKAAAKVTKKATKAGRKRR